MLWFDYVRKELGNDVPNSFGHHHHQVQCHSLDTLLQPPEGLQDGRHMRVVLSDAVILKGRLIQHIIPDYWITPGQSIFDFSSLHYKHFFFVLKKLIVMSNKY